MSHIAVTELDIDVGYLDNWVGNVGAPSDVRGLKTSARTQLLARYGWLNGPFLNRTYFDNALALLVQEYTDHGDIRVDTEDDNDLKSVVNLLIAAKRPADAPELTTRDEANIEVKGCRPCKNPPPFCWENSHSYRLFLEDDDDQAEVAADFNGIQRPVRLQVFVRYCIEET